MSMKNNIVTFLVGFLFAIGLGISGMTQPHKVIGFLDIFGNWDPSLIFVMGGSVLVHMITFRLITKRKSPLLATNFQIPLKKEVTPQLIVGSIIFGIGWGLGGFCPGPAITSLASFDQIPVMFVVAMIAGMILYRAVEKYLPIKK